MELLEKVIAKRGMKFEQVERTNDVALYAQYINGQKIAFEVFSIRKASGFTFPNGLEVKPKEVYPKDEDFGKTAWSIKIFDSESLTFEKALGKFKELIKTKNEKRENQSTG